LDRFFQRLNLEGILRQHLPTDDVRLEIPTCRIAMLLVRNVLVAREPMYAVPEWAARYSPELLDLYHDQMPLLHDDRLGNCLEQLCHAPSDMIMAVVNQAIREFRVSLDELHNDSTSVALYGNYSAAAEPVAQGGRRLPAITWGHSKDHRPDLKQLLFTLTLTRDGGVPVYFSVDSGNTNDDTTHRQTWDTLARLVGGPDFLYVADCKLASHDNLCHIAGQQGRFITVLPRGRREDSEFRRRLRESPPAVEWEDCWIREEENLRPGDVRPPKVVDVFRTCSQESVTSDGFRLIWYHSRRKAELDEVSRGKRSQRAIRELEKLQTRLSSPRTRFRQREMVQRAVSKILSRRKVDTLLRVEISAQEEETFRQQGRGRPSAKTKYRREVKTRFRLSWSVDDAGWREAAWDDGTFPLLTNDRSLTASEVLQAYKRQPVIEKRFSQLKSDFDVAPIFLKSPARILGLFTIYFLALLVQSLLERELRLALAEELASGLEESGEEGTIGIYPEGRRTRRPTARRVLDALEPIRRHELCVKSSDGTDAESFFDELTEVQRRVVRLFGITPATYGR
jgi:transposase